MLILAQLGQVKVTNMMKTSLREGLILRRMPIITPWRRVLRRLPQEGGLEGEEVPVVNRGGI